MLKKSLALILSLCIMFLGTDFLLDNKGMVASAKEKGVADYTYTITPILELFNEYFFVKTDNPDPMSFRFVDNSTVYGENGTCGSLNFLYDSWNDETIIFSDVVYEDKSTSRVKGGYIFEGNNTDGGYVTLQYKKDISYSEYDKLIQTEGSANVGEYTETISSSQDGGVGFKTYYVIGYYKWEDTSIKIKLPKLVSEIDYLVDTYATKKNFFDNMDAVQSGFSSICLYSGSYIRGELYKSGAFWSLSTSPHKDQLFYLQSPYSRKENKKLFASEIYPFRYDSLGFPSMMARVSEKLNSSSTYQWDEYSHAHINVTYNGETHMYGGQGNGEGQGITEDKIKYYFSFGTDNTKITLQSAKKLLEDYSKIEMKDDVPRKDALTWEKVCDTVNSGAWVRLIDFYSIFGGMQTGYTYLYKENDGKSHWTDSSGDNGSEIYWGGDLGHISDAWVDGRYIDAWECFVQGEKFEDHPTSGIILTDVKIPQVTYDYDYDYNFDTSRYDIIYSNIKVTEKSKTVLFEYDSENNIWVVDWDAFDDRWSGYNTVVEFTEKGLIDKKYLDMITLTLDEVKTLHVDRNTDIIPEKGFIYDGTVEPGTPYEYISLTDERVNINLSSSIFTYDGKVNIPKITVTCKGKTLKENTDYTVTYSNKSSKDAGRYTIKIEGIGEYKGSVTKSYRIVPQAKSIKIDKTAVDICVGENSMLKATTDPTGAAAGVVWTSSNTKVATVTNGVVTGISKGTATITAKTNDGKTANCTVKVSVAVTGVTLNKTVLTLNKGETSVLTATVMPSDAGNKSITWTSSNEKVASVSNGKITAVSGGTTTITATTSNGKTAKCVVNVKVPVKDISFKQTSAVMREGSELLMNVNITPNDADDKTVIWKSSDTSVATVNSGKIVAIHEGTTVITATSSNGKMSSCKIIVKDANSIIPTGDTNGDGKATIADSLMIARYEVKLRTLTDEQLAVSDVNYDGKVNISDALKIARYEVKLIDSL